MREDHHAERAAKEVARGLSEGLLPPFIGIRVKTLSEELKRRAVRTLDIFVSTLVAETGGTLPPNFVITLPKIAFLRGGTMNTISNATSTERTMSVMARPARSVSASARSAVSVASVGPAAGA